MLAVRPAGAGVAAGLAVLTLALDQWTKALIQRDLGPGAGRSTIPLVGDWFLLEYGRNRGAAFGAFAGGAPAAVLPLVALAILVGVVVYAARLRFHGRWLAIGSGLLVGGAIGNLVDRARFGYVIDFVAIGPWPNFNVADAAISVGVLCLAADAMLRPSDDERVLPGGDS